VGSGVNVAKSDWEQATVQVMHERSEKNHMESNTGYFNYCFDHSEWNHPSLSVLS
jgi:hypothetical protein